MYTDGYILATYFIKLQYVIKVISCSCNGAWLVIICSVWKYPGAHQYPLFAQEVFQQLYGLSVTCTIRVSLKGCNCFLPIRIAGSYESRIFLYWLKISFQIQLSYIHDKICWILRNIIMKPAISDTPLRMKRSPILPLYTKASLWQSEVLWGMKLHRKTIDCQ